MRFVKEFFLLDISYKNGIIYPVPLNLNYFWNFGVLALFSLVIQLITGILLAMHFVPHIDLAFASIEHIMRDVNNGWLLRYLHANGASMFFFVVYIHLFRGLYYGSYIFPREILWSVGVIILLIMIMTAFMGYVLPWGQMSFWAATVITNLVTVIPFVGQFILEWLLGGFSVGNPTLNRFFSLHYLLPFVLVALVFIHIILLHVVGSSNPIGVNLKYNKIPFNPYFTFKDLVGILVFILFYFCFVFFLPNYLGHSDNYIEANSLSTPSHIVPEWYFLPLYAILRAVPDKLGGVLLLFFAIIVLFLLPFLVEVYIRSSIFKPLSRFLFWLIFIDCLILGWLGGESVISPFYEIGQITTSLFFLFFLVFKPLINNIELFLIGVNKKYI